MTRRTKEQVAADLPAKQQQVLAVELDAKHRRTYQRHLQRERQKVLGLIDDVDRNRFTILRSLTLLRRLALHPGLVDDGQAGSGSAKIDALIEHLAEVVSGGHRALVFSQFTGYLALVRDAPARRRNRPTPTSTARPATAARSCRASGRRGPGIPDQPQGRRVRA